MMRTIRVFNQDGSETQIEEPMSDGEIAEAQRREALENLALQLDAASTQEVWAAMDEVERNQTLAAICQVGALAVRASI